MKQFETDGEKTMESSGTNSGANTRRRFLLAASVVGTGGLLAACDAARSAAPPAQATPTTASRTTSPVIDKIGQSRKLRVGWAVWSPYFIKDPSGKVTGIAPRIIEQMAAELNATPEWVEDSWGTVIAGLNADKFDLSLALDPILPRALAAGFSNSYGTISTNLMIRKADAAKYKTWQDANKQGIKIGVTLGASTDQHVTKAFTNAEIVRLKTLPESILALTSGQVDGVGSSIGPARDAIKENPQLDVLTGALGSSGQTIMVKRDDQISLNWLNLFISELERSGQLDAFYKEHGIDRNQVF